MKWKDNVNEFEDDESRSETKRLVFHRRVEFIILPQWILRRMNQKHNKINKKTIGNEEKTRCGKREENSKRRKNAT